MRKNIQLHIPEPCHEDWNAMTLVEKGRFCASCQKKVIDFTSMSDEQLVAFFRKRGKDFVCGRFMNHQLHRAIEVPRKRIPWVRYFFQFALPAFLASSKAASQGQVKIVSGKPAIVVNPISDGTRNALAREKSKKISGKIVDEMGTGISYASIYIKGTPTGTSCDSTGGFAFDCREPGDTIVLQTSCVGFQPVETVLSLKDNIENVVVTLNTLNTLDEVVVKSPGNIVGSFVVGAIGVVTKQDIFDMIREKIFPAQNSWKFYPNPVQRNSVLTVETKKVTEGNHLFQLLSANGQTIRKQEFWIDKNSTAIKFDISKIADGVYFLRIVNKQSGKSITEKIVVQ